MFNIILHNPQIPPNTGNIVRLCANTGASLHLIRPLGFKIDEKSYRRAGLDYHNENFLSTHDNFEECLDNIKSKSVYAITKFGTRCYTDIKFNSGDAILFGSETKGLPSNVINKFIDEKKIFIPMIRNSRSLNLSNAVSLVVYEAWRQLNFINSEKL